MITTRLQNNRVNKRDLVKKIKTDLLKVSEDLTLSKINAVLDITVDSIMDYLKQGKEIFWTGLGGFVFKKRKQTTRRNPQNGETIKIPAKEVVKMKLFRSFTDKCAIKTKKSTKK